MARRFLRGITLTVNSTGGAVNLLTALKAIDSTSPTKCRQIQFQAAGANGASTIYVGDELVATTRAACTLGASDIILFSAADMDLLDISDFWILSSADGAKLNVAVLES